MPGTRYKLIGECVVWIVKSPDAILKRVLTELKQVKKIKSITKRKPKKGGKKKKKATAKQIKARKLFAMRAKRGDFR
jgi:hypothetical protein